MKNNITVCLLSTLVVSSMAVVGQSRADYMNWSYSTGAAPHVFSATAPDKGSGVVQLTPFTNAAGAATIPILAYVTSATSSVMFAPKTSTYSLTLTITDNATHDHGSLTFSGALAGGLTPTTSSLINTFSGLTKSLRLDGHVYNVTLPSSAALAAPTAPQESILATVRVDDSGGGSGVPGLPEPAGLILAVLGAISLAVRRFWPTALEVSRVVLRR